MMARTKKSSSSSRTKSLSTQEVYRCLNGKWHLLAEGHEILALCTEEDIKPDTNYYMVNAMRPTVFYECYFSPLVEWDTIQTLIKYKRIWRLKDGVLV